MLCVAIKERKKEKTKRKIREREKKGREREEEKKEKKKGNAYHILLMYTHPLFKKCLRLSPPQASLGNSESALFKERKKENQAASRVLGSIGPWKQHTHAQQHI